MRLYRDRAVVLRQHKLGEADRIVTLLTRDHGLVRAVAKGVRRTRSKFGSRLEPFAHIDVQLHPGRNLDIVTQVVSIDAFAADIVNDYGRYTCGCAILETAERLAGEERNPMPALQRLTVGALRAVSLRRDDDQPVPQIADRPLVFVAELLVDEVRGPADIVPADIAMINRLSQHGLQPLLVEEGEGQARLGGAAQTAQLQGRAWRAARAAYRVSRRA